MPTRFTTQISFVTFTKTFFKQINKHSRMELCHESKFLNICKGTFLVWLIPLFFGFVDSFQNICLLEADDLLDEMFGDNDSIR